MLASQVSVRDLSSYSECTEAIEKIENDYRNSEGGLEAWNSGYNTYLKAGAERKIAAINRRIDTKFSNVSDDCCEYAGDCDCL